MTLADLEHLLLVQEADTLIDQLVHRREAMPERAELAAAEARAGALAAELRTLVGERDEVLREERKLDDDVQALVSRIEDVDRKLYSGTVTSPRELQALQADADSLRKHRSEIEDLELDVMERRETLDAQVGGLEAKAAEETVVIGQLQAAIGAAEAEIDEQLGAERAGRAERAEAVPGATLADYERRRAKNRGIGVARLVGGTCQACRLSIPTTEADRIRREPEADLYGCDNCNAILVPMVS